MSVYKESDNNINKLNYGSLSLEDFQHPDSMRIAGRVMEAVPTMIAVFDKDSKYIYANKTYVDMVNSKHDTWVGKTIQEYLPSYLLENITPRINRAVKGEELSYYLDIVPADGIGRTILVNYKPLTNESGENDCSLMCGLDVTDFKNAEQRIFSSQSLETLGRMTGGIAHDFNNQMSIILGIISLLKLKIKDEEVLNFISMSEKAANSCVSLTSQMLAFARRQSLEPKAFNVGKSINQFLDIVKVSLPDNINCTLELLSDDVVKADPVQFESVIINLMFNARDAMPSGGNITLRTRNANDFDSDWFDEFSIDVDTERVNPDDFVVVEVADNGIGMNEDVVSRVFEPFFTTKDKMGGTGMGMAMVYGFAKQSGGNIEIVSAPGLGTTVRLFLPRSEHAEHYKKQSTLSQAKASMRLKFLLVEDDPIITEVLTKMLDVLSHISVSCDNAQDALRIAGSEKIDIVLTDVSIKGDMDGLELRQVLLAEHPDIRVICTSGYLEPKSMYPSLDSEIEFLPKPVTLEALANKLNQDLEL